MFVIQRDFGHRGPSHFSMQLLCQSLGMLLMAFEQFQALFQQRFQLCASEMSVLLKASLTVL